MPKHQFLVRNRHNHIWYGRVVIPLHLRPQFHGKREFRVSLKTSDKHKASRMSLRLWMQCQDGFDTLKSSPQKRSFRNAQSFLYWLSAPFSASGKQTMIDNDDNAGEKLRKKVEEKDYCHLIETVDILGRKHVFDLNDPVAEAKLMHMVMDQAQKLFDTYKDQPEVLSEKIGILDKAAGSNVSIPMPAPETVMNCSEAIDLYIKKLQTQGHKGRKLTPRTLDNYTGKLLFWKDYFGPTLDTRQISLQSLAKIQTTLTQLPANYSKKGMDAKRAMHLASEEQHNLPVISDKTRAEYLAQLKGFLSYAHSSGFTSIDFSLHIEIPNTKRVKATLRLPFTSKDLQKIFSSHHYETIFTARKSSVSYEAKFWFPLIALFSGMRLEEIAQLTTDDIQTDKETGIAYFNITNRGFAADGKPKSTKTQSSVRPVPIHSQLINIGFLDYVEQRTGNALFDLKRDKQGRLAKGLGNWFSRFETRKSGRIIKGFIEQCSVDSKGTNKHGENWTKSFHSFRHTAIDNLRGRQLSTGEYIREDDIGLVMGHSKADLETTSYGKDRSQLKLRQAVIETLDYKNVDFDKIRWKQ